MRPLALAGLVLASPAAAQELPARFTVTGVAAGDVLNLREAPSAGAPATGALEPGQLGVEVVELSPDGAWGLVSLPEGAAWAAMRYLSPDPVAATPLPRPLRCMGTEPFWTLAVDDQGERWVTPEGTTYLRPLAEAGGFAGGVLAFDRGGETLDLTVVRRACSDGMSDRPFGLTAFVWNRGAEFLEGCCTLADR